MNTFEDRLLAQLTDIDAARPTLDGQPPRRRRSRLHTSALLVPAVAAALVVASVVNGAILSRRSTVTPPGEAAVQPASFTLVRNADGSVTFTVHDLLDLTGATAALNDAGIVGRVVTNTEDCTTGPNAVPVNPNDLYPPDTLHHLGNRGGISGTDTVTVSTADYPAGGGLLISVGGDMRQDNELHLVVTYLAYVDATKIPECVNWVDPGTGQFPAWPPEPRHT
jgi:hypothetical protein